MRWRGRKQIGDGAGGSGGAATAVVERPFLDEMRAVEQLLPIPPDEINRRVLGTHLTEADLVAAERLNGMNLRYFDAVVRPLLDEWRIHRYRQVNVAAQLHANTFLGGLHLADLDCGVQDVLD